MIVTYVLSFKHFLHQMFTIWSMADLLPGPLIPSCNECIKIKIGADNKKVLSTLSIICQVYLQWLWKKRRLCKKESMYDKLRMIDRKFKMIQKPFSFRQYSMKFTKDTCKIISKKANCLVWIAIEMCIVSRIKHLKLI